MSMRVAAIACANGLGHIKRLLKVIHCLYDRIENLNITLFCEKWQIIRLERWVIFENLRKHLDVVPISLPVIWKGDQEYYGDWLLNWHHIFTDLSLPQFDYVISDNLIEPLLYSDRVVLGGSFLWHDVLINTFPENKSVQYYQNWAQDILLSVRPNMIVNRYFAMPATEQQTKSIKTGVIHFCNVNRIRRDRERPECVLIAIGNAEMMDEQLDQVINSLPFFNQMGSKVFCSKNVYQILIKRFDDIRLYDFENHRLDMIDLAVVRGGLGTISDCIAAKIPMLCIHDSNCEMEFNRERLVHWGIGMSLKESLTRNSSPLTDSNSYHEMIGRFNHFSLKGEVDTADFLLKRFGGD